MSTPPRVDVPDGIVVDRRSVRSSHRAAMHTDVARAASWAVFVPGFTGSKEDFVAVLPLLADADVGVVTFDQLDE